MQVEIYDVSEQLSGAFSSSSALFPSSLSVCTRTAALKGGREGTSARGRSLVIDSSLRPIR